MNRENPHQNVPWAEAHFGQGRVRTWILSESAERPLLERSEKKSKSPGENTREMERLDLAGSVIL